MPFLAKLSATQAIERLSANDPTLVTCDLSKSSVMEKGAECATTLHGPCFRSSV
jgi:hypothetical protein